MKFRFAWLIFAALSIGPLALSAAPRSWSVDEIEPTPPPAAQTCERQMTSGGGTCSGYVLASRDLATPGSFYYQCASTGMLFVTWDSCQDYCPK